MSQTPKPGLRPWLKIVLALSLALNLAVIGVGAGAAWRYHDAPHGSKHRRDKPPMLGRFIFKDIGRQEMHRLLKQHEGDSQSAADRRRAEMDQMITLLQAEKLDRTAVAAVLEAHIVETHQFLRLVVDVWGQRLEGLSLTERRRLAERMQHQLER